MNYITNLYIFSLVFGMHPICENGLTVIVCCGAAEKSSNRVIAFYPVAWDFVFFPCCHLSAEMQRYYLMPIRRDRQRLIVARRMQRRAADGQGTDRPPYFNLLQWPSGDPER